MCGIPEKKDKHHTAKHIKVDGNNIGSSTPTENTKKVQKNGKMEKNKKNRKIGKYKKINKHKKYNMKSQK